MGLLDYDAINLGEKDLQYGREFLVSMRDAYQLPFISANVYDRTTGRLFARPFTIKKVGETRIGVLGFTDIHGMSQTLKPELGFEIKDPIAAAKSTLAELKPQCDIIVALSHLGLRRSYEIAEQVSGIDILISGHNGSHLRAPKQIGKVLVMQPGSQGKYLGQFDITLAGSQIVDLKGKTVSLSASIPDDERLAGVVQEFDNELLAKFPLETPKAKENASSFSERSCRMCHLQEYKQWTSTLHSHAWETLVREKQNHNPECQECHTTLYEQPNGFATIADTPDMVNVQCSQCHQLAVDDVMTHFKRGRVAKKSANGESNRIASDFKPISEQTCLTCHNQENSPTFEYSKFLMKVTH
ncbi:hypothetical protein MJD09_07140 [bacterium]|nr:hypothetical protein [bacterium]